MDGLEVLESGMTASGGGGGLDQRLFQLLGFCGCCQSVRHLATLLVVVIGSHDDEGWFSIFQEVEISRLVEISTLMTKALNITSNPCSHYTTALLVINLCDTN
jgi:hypothetical protein